jgi:23S rRNA (guanosine2251-2'-O)-methyltransferase
LFVAFDGIYDPQNLGNAVRTAACFGFDALFIPRDNACGVTETVVNVARGGAAVVAISRVTNMHRRLEALKKRNVFCFGLDERADRTLFNADLTVPLCLVLGGEKGLRRLTRESCDTLFKIPTAEGFPSLNVASAFAVAAYEAVRQRGAKKTKADDC